MTSATTWEFFTLPVNETCSLKEQHAVLNLRHPSAFNNLRLTFFPFFLPIPRRENSICTLFLLDLSWSLFDCHVFSISLLFFPFFSDPSDDKRKVILWEIFMTFIEMEVCEEWNFNWQFSTYFSSTSFFTIPRMFKRDFQNEFIMTPIKCYNINIMN